MSSKALVHKISALLYCSLNKIVWIKGEKGLTASPQVVDDIVDFVASLLKKKKP